MKETATYRSCGNGAIRSSPEGSEWNHLREAAILMILTVPIDLLIPWKRSHKLTLGRCTTRETQKQAWEPYEVQRWGEEALRWNLTSPLYRVIWIKDCSKQCVTLSREPHDDSEHYTSGFIIMWFVKGFWHALPKLCSSTVDEVQRSTSLPQWWHWSDCLLYDTALATSGLLDVYSF